MNDKAEEICMLGKEYITLSVGKNTGTEGLIKWRQSLQRHKVP